MHIKFLDDFYLLRSKFFTTKSEYYLIRRPPPAAGFYSNWFYYLAQAIRGEMLGLKPVIDAQYYTTLYSEIEQIHGTYNAWEYYFTQEHSVDDVRKSRCYLPSDYLYHREHIPYRIENRNLIFDDQLLETFRYASSKYAALKPDLKKAIEDFKKLNFKSPILGVHYRGTDKIQASIGHEANPPMEEYIKATKKVIKEKLCESIFLSTDQEEFLIRFKQEIDIPIYCTNGYRKVNLDGYGIHTEINSVDQIRKNHHYQLGCEVIIDTGLLAECDYLIHGHSNITNAAVILNRNKYIERYYLPFHF
jgi:hypothetical protein